jgi:tetratricopeptide (TPR) repeat protein
MRRYKWFALILIIGAMVAGCVTFLQSEDMRLSNKGLKEVKKGYFQEAEKYLQKALSIKPDNPYAIPNISVVYFNTDRKEQARENFNKVISIAEKENAQDSNENWAVGKELVEISKRNLEYMNK